MFRFDERCDQIATNDKKNINTDVATGEDPGEAGVVQNDGYNGDCS